MFQDLHVIYECTPGLLKLGKTTHEVCFVREMHSFHFRGMHCHHDEEVVQSLLGPSDSPLVASLNLGAQDEWVLVPFESSLFPGARSILIFDGSLPQDFECSDCSAQLGIQQ
jgi:hypothetical protein